MDDMLAAALRYAERGWRVFPIRHGSKAPPLIKEWQVAATTDVTQITAWWAQWPAANIGIATGRDSGLYVVDLDEGIKDGKVLNGIEQWNQLNLSDNVETLSQKTPRGGIHLIYEYPELAEGTELNNTGQKLASNVDTRGEGGYILAAPSIVDVRSGLLEGDWGRYAQSDSPVAKMPEVLRHRLLDIRAPTAISAGARAIYSPSNASAWERAAVQGLIRQLHQLSEHGWSRHWDDGCFSVACRLIEIANVPATQLTTESAYELFMANAPSDDGFYEYHHNKKWQSALNKIGDKQATVGEYNAEQAFHDLAGEDAIIVKPSEAKPRVSYLNLPDEFWQATDTLSYIRKAAHSKAAVADVVLYGVLARISAQNPPGRGMYTGIDDVSLNIAVSLYGRSGTGKSSGWTLSRALMPSGPALVNTDELPIGSGEGIAESFMGDNDNPEATRDDKRRRVMVNYNALFYCDEGQGLNKLMNQPNSVLGATIRSAISGEALGQTNASKDRIRRIPRREYSLALAVGYQLEPAIELLKDSGTGTPQRFFWVSTTDPSIPDNPEEMEINKLPTLASWDAPPLSMDKEIMHELRKAKISKARGEFNEDDTDADSQAPVMKVKLATLLAVLHLDSHVDAEYWRLANVMYDTSCRVRNSILDLQRRKEARTRELTNKLKGDQAVAIEEAVEFKALIKLSKWIERKVNELGPITHGALYRKVDGSRRVLFDDALEHALSLNLISQPSPRTYGRA